LLCIEVPPVIQADWFIAESFRVLQPDGVLMGVFGNLLSVRGLLGHAKARFTRLGPFNFYRVAYPQWRRRMCQAGFHLQHEEGICWPPFGRRSDSNLIPIFTWIESALGLRRMPVVSPWVVFAAQKAPTNTTHR
jgi:hypothetical protein